MLRRLGIRDDTAPKTSSAASPPRPSRRKRRPSEPARKHAEGDPERFATAYAQVAALFTELNSAPSEAQPTSTEEANAAAGLDDTTALIFADYSVLPDETGGSLCLQSDTGTYLAVSYADATGEVDLGDGECSYDPTAALVVGDIATDTWTVGAEYMGDALPTGVFGS